ncbi:bacterial Ig-like domain-containing protein [Lactiplantibacillus paraplantarum]|uniref:Beta-fructosidase n=1 Tax=Lactiplantibacillus paraplantarum TaxID=60520 RepID=A0AAD0TN20_9LACO|nr:bacterial Ig-like domain-containing protein [Lactiplantibacillus paraplantarum]AVW09863.1 DUF5011 domain-containing protein [Lactiplantibacillus paraplantarum]AYJ38074.1 DUF5011 domain-containing protein [Lactiplantibacillus paraplantarum]ERL43114.1 cell wall anchor domain-containing protein [Lactiplantibacillus paraplantarum]KRL48197.1 beta-fructosidase precursor [Lactiplantibacillus paraplantarum DSM 10667]MCU4683037.1 DUF5011 domain-containing protein [Lactiplantibacillus paraplantarum]
MKKSVTTKEHYKMYKKGKIWLFAGLATLTWQVGIVAQADTVEGTSTNDASSTSTTDQSHVTASSVTLGSSRAASSSATATEKTNASATTTVAASDAAAKASQASSTTTSSSTVATTESTGATAATSAAASSATATVTASAVVTSASSDEATRVGAASSAATSTGTTATLSTTSAASSEAGAAGSSAVTSSADSKATASVATSAKIMALDATVSTSDTTSAAKDYAGYHASTNVSSGIFGTSEWWVDEDEVLHIGGGTLASTEAYMTQSDTINGIAYTIGSLNTNTITVPWFKEFVTNSDGDVPITKVVLEDKVIAASDASGLFAGLVNVTSIEGLENLDTSNVVYMAGMFEQTMHLTSLNLSNFNTSKVVDMTGMFFGMGFQSETSFELDVSSFNTSNVTNMATMFAYSKVSRLDLSNFDTSHVTNMMQMFALDADLTQLNVSSFDTSHVQLMMAMFGFCSSLTSLNVTNFDTSQVVLMQQMFENCSSLTSLDLSSFDMSNAADTTDVSDIYNGLYLMLYEDNALKQLTLNKSSKLTVPSGAGVQISAGLLDITANDVYTGKWEQRDAATNQKTGKAYTTNELNDLYTSATTVDATYTYVWQTWIDTQATTLIAGPTTTWHASDNFISAINPEEVSVALGTGTDDVTYAIADADGQVYAAMPTTTPGTYTVTYSFVDNGTTYDNTATVTIVASQAALTTADSTLVATTDPAAKWTPSDNVTGILDNTGQTIDFADADITVSGADGINLSQAGTYPVTYTYTDASGNQDTQVATITVTANNSTINASVSTVIAGPSVIWTAGDNLAGAVDTTGDEATATTSDTVDAQTPGTYQVTYTFTDSTGSLISKTVTVTVVASAAELAVKDSTFVATTNPAAKWTASDNVTAILDNAGQRVSYVDANITVAGADKVDLRQAGTYHVTYTYTDASGNEKTATATITVTANQSIIDANDSTVIAGPATTWTASDNLIGATDTNGTKVSATTSDTVDPQKPGTYNVRYTFTDSTGSVITKTVVVTVKASQASVTATDSVIKRGATWQAADNLISVVDAQGHPLSLTSAHVTTTGTVDSATPGTYHVTYHYTDVGGNVVTAQAAVVVTGVILKENAKTIVTTSAWHPNDSIASAIGTTGADAIDAVNVAITNAVGATVTSYTALGQYDVAYELNGQTTVLTLTVASAAKITASDGAVILGSDWSASDNLVAVVDENGQNVDLTDARITTIGTVDTTTPGSYHVSYQYTDAAGNATISKPITVNVTGITLKDSNKTMTTTNDWTPAENIQAAVDATGANVIGDVTYTVSATRARSIAALNHPGEYTVTYSFTDQLGTHTASMVVTVVSAAQVNVKDSTIVVGNQWTSATNLTRVLDENGAQISLTDARITTSGVVDTMTPGRYHVTYAYTDGAGNVVSAVATVTVVADTTDDNDTDGTNTSGSDSNDGDGGANTEDTSNNAGTDTKTDNAGRTDDDSKDTAIKVIGTATDRVTDTNDTDTVTNSDEDTTVNVAARHQSTSATLKYAAKTTVAGTTVKQPMSNTQPVAAAALPQTDETNSTNTLTMAGMVTLALSGLLGLFGWRKRDRNEQ